MPFPYILLAGLYCFLIFENSAVADPLPMDVALPISDKVIHGIVFGGLCAIISLGMRRSDRAVSWRTLIVLPVLFATAYGVSDEVHQSFVPGRSYEYGDMLADFLGACIAQLVLIANWWLVQGKVPNFSSSE